MERLPDEYIYDLAYWRRILKPPRSKQALNDAASGVGPMIPVVWEAKRRRAAADLAGLEAFPEDIFVFARGEPQVRAVTKLGGLPYRPQHQPWPRNRDGVPLTFLCQFRLSESRDIVGDTPGDMLLVFTSSEACDDCVLEWHKLGLNELTQPEDVPTSDWILPCCYGVFWRTISYPIPATFDQYVPPMCGGPMLISSAAIAPPGELPPRTRAVLILRSYHPQPDVEYPWMNVRKPISEAESRKPENRLCLIDMFTFAIYLTDRDMPEYELHS